jgi:hypothetical protein
VWALFSQWEIFPQFLENSPILSPVLESSPQKNNIAYVCMLPNYAPTNHYYLWKTNKCVLLSSKTF